MLRPSGTGDVSTLSPTQRAWYMSTSAGRQSALDCMVHVNRGGLWCIVTRKSGLS